ncbi:hypothetical protein HELRODRAFT_189009, partial [Helobdella robusta]|uniref:DOP1-like TPR domain-containing protein n=1 Tax=Helobdella robusta TaxID=6412 RepID=T1FQK0_HELRO
MHATAAAYNEHDDDNDDDGENAAVSDGDDVVPCRSYHQAYLNILNEKTCFYKLAGGSVWMTMLRAMVDGESTGSLKMVELFNDIHQHAPHSHICEEVITEGMLSRCQNEKVTATMQFLSFWQKLKEMDTLITRKKTYEKAIVIMLDDLDSDNQVYSSLAKSWLISCVKVNELSNIIEPVLKVLLHPDTARISVQQLEKSSSMQPNKSLATSSQLLIQQSDQQEQNEQKVVAVSNEGGNIMYHVDSSNRFKPPKVVSSFEDCPALALTTLSDKGSSTRKAAILLDNYLSTNRPMPSNVTLRVNPFGSSAVSDDEDDDLVYGMPKEKSSNDKMAGNVSSIAKSAIRLDKETCLKEKIIFEDEKHGATNDHQESVDFNGTDQNNFSSEHNNLTITSIKENDVDDSSSNDKSGDGLEDGSNKVESSSGDEVAIEIINNIIEELFDDGLKEELKEMGGLCDFTEFVGYNANDCIGVNDNTNNINDINHNVNNTNDDVEEETNLDDDAKVLKKRFERFGSLELNKTYNANSNRINSLRSFVLLYIRHYDSARILYVLKLLKSLILTDTRLVIQSLMNITHFSVNRNKMEQNIILDLFLRHKQSILGHEFHAPLPYDVLDNHANNSNYLELVISILLYFVRSYYPCKSIEADNLPDKTRDVDTTLQNNKQKNTSVDNVNEAANNKSKLMMVDMMNANKEVHINCCLLLKTIFHELTKIIASDIKAAFSVSELLIKSK